MKNTFEIRGDITAIFLKRRSGEVLETIIDTEDLSMMNEFKGTWHAAFNKFTNSFYAFGNFKNETGKFTRKGMHRYLMGDPFGYEIDHFNHNTLDNRRSFNLRITTKSENQQNRLSSNTNNRSSGIRGVSFNKNNGKWHAHAKINGKKVFLGYHDDLKKAEKVVVDYRTRTMKHSQEHSEVI